MHLPSGRLGLHLMTDAEVKLLGEQVNYDELLELLRIEKGKAAVGRDRQVATHSGATATAITALSLLRMKLCNM